MFINYAFENQHVSSMFINNAFVNRALRIGQTRGRALQPQVHLAAVKPRASRSDVGFA